jgi:integrase/recombinase XerD
MSEQEFPSFGSLSLQSVEELEHPLILKDKWHGEKDLGMRVNRHLKQPTIYFDGIKQDWIKIATKKLILYGRSQGKSFGTLQVYAKDIRYFANFLETQAVCSFNDINDEILSQYHASLQSLALKTINNRLSSLKAFFIVGSINNWFEVSTYWFQGKMPKVKPKNINYIPKEVLTKLDEHLHLLPEQLQRLVVLIRVSGLRASEILQMQFDCLRQRKNGQWELHFINWKFNEREDILPILPEIAEIIKQQQAYIKSRIGKEHQYLFSGYLSSGKSLSKKVLTLDSFSSRLNKLAKDKNICDKNGNLWRFKTHQFRRTVATKMTNEGVRQYIIQRYLRHDNPDMMQHYASILPETEKREINQLHKQKIIVDVTGQEVSINHPELDNDIGLQWLRSKMQPKALAMGFCARPQLLKPCPHANACMSCEHLRLDEEDLPALRQHLERNQKLKQESEQKGYLRQLKGIEKDTTKLINLINTLEEKDD